MTTYREFQEELQRLHLKSESARRIEKAEALARIRALIVEYQLLPSDLGFGRAPTAKADAAASTAAAKYRDPTTGATWSGRGRPPRWLDGKDRTTFEIG
jgi:DNA-binding protein H-NS